MMQSQVGNARLRLPLPLPIAVAGLLALAIVNGVALARPIGSSAWLQGPASDDAYYYFSVARNLAAGEGLTYTGRPTNGFQPLYLGVSYLVGQLVAWDSGGLPAAMYFLNWLVFSGLGSCFAYRIGRLLFPELRPPRSLLPVLTWLSFTPALRLTTNGMETSFVLTAWCGVVLCFLEWCVQPRSLLRAAVLGLALGLTFLARNDAVVLVAAVGLYMLVTLVRGPESLPKRLAPLALTAALTALLVAPWLTSNLLRFGQLVPQSGAAEALGSLYDAGRPKQVVAVVLALARNLCPLPLPLDTLPALARTASGVVLLVLFVAWVVSNARQVDARGRAGFVVLAAACALLAVIYAAAFGAPHMCNRWLAPVCVLGFLALSAWACRSSGRAAALITLVLLVGALSRAVVDARRSTQTNTWAIAQFALAHRGQGPIGTLQSGLPNWLVPDVQNIDGKVNPGALAAIREGRLDQWLVQSDLEWVVDWDFFGYDQSPIVLEAFARSLGEDGLIILRRKARALGLRHPIGTDPPSGGRHDASSRT